MLKPPTSWYLHGVFSINLGKFHHDLTGIMFFLEIMNHMNTHPKPDLDLAVTLNKKTCRILLDFARNWGVRTIGGLSWYIGILEFACYIY